jgi:hypothetical protein
MQHATMRVGADHCDAIPAPRMMRIADDQLRAVVVGSISPVRPVPERLIWR